MSNLKKSFFGGYKKESVDIMIDELNKKIEDLEKDNARLKRDTENSGRKFFELEEALAGQAAENEKLKSNITENEIIFKDIAKVYKRAYGAGMEIACESKAVAQNMLNSIDNKFIEVMNETRAIIEEYESARRDIDSAFTTLNGSIKRVADNTAIMLEKSKRFSGIYDELRETVNKAKEDNERVLEEYETCASEFMNNGTSKSIEKNRSDIEGCESNISIEPSSDVLMNEHVAYSKEHTKENSETKTEELTDKSQSQNETPPQPIIDQANELTTDTLKEADTFSEEKSDTASNAHHDDEFTQFGRKSRISSQDRNEMLRKVLLKNGGN